MTTMFTTMTFGFRLLAFVIAGLTCLGASLAIKDSSILIDCYPDPNASQDACNKRGCTWNSNVPQGAPYCYYKTDPDSFAGYDMANNVLTRRNTPSIYGDDVDQLNFVVNAVSDTELQISIGPNAVSQPGAKVSDSNLFEVQTSASPFGFAVVRKSTGTVLFDTRAIPGVESDGNSHGVFLNTTYPMQIALQPDPNVISYLVIGGMIDLHFYLGPEPDTVVQQYVSSIGRPQLPPQWGLGFQLSRYGYASLNQAIDVYTRNMNAGIPIETMYFDIDFMDSFKDFTIGQNFAGLGGFATTLHNAHQKLVLMVDCAIGATPDSSYEAQTLGLSMDVFVKDGTDTSTPFVGKVWPGIAYFPDFTSPNIVAYWTQVHKDFYKLVNFDGIWNDMNEPSNFDYGSDKGGCPATKTNNPPFNPLFGDALYDKTLCPDAVHAAGLHYELHNVYGHDEIKTTYAALAALFPGKRPFVLSRSTHSGSGQYAAKWTGDVNSNWGQLGYSIIGMLDFNMFGLPFVGADICGFTGDTNQELCVRWHQVGAFYPFSRNHNNKGSRDQDPAVWDSASVAAIKKVLDTRTTLIPTLYTLLAASHANGGTTVRPLFFHWPTDSNTWNLASQYMWGSSMMFAPILTQGATSRQVYFPAGTWYQYPSGSMVSTGGESKSVNMAIDETGIFTLNKTIHPIQRPGANTAQSRRNSAKGLLITSDSHGVAEGRMYWDDGETQDAKKLGQYAEIRFRTAIVNRTLQLLVTADSPVSGIWPKIGAVTFDHFIVYGCQSKWFTGHNLAQVNGKPQAYHAEFPAEGVAKLEMSQGLVVGGDGEYVIQF